MQRREVIAAIATAPGRGGVGVIRVSGPALQAWVQPMFRAPLSPRLARYGAFLDSQGQTLDQGLALFFPAPHSFTGEDVIELHGHGGPVIMQLLLQRCLELGARPAEPGEFSKRAFLNGKIDLAQAESIADLIDASSATAARSAMRSLQGLFSQKIQALVEGLIHLRMLLEATLDFPEEDIDFLEAADAMGQLQRLQQQLQQVQASAQQGRLLREGMHVVLVGQPNVGKSSLLNALAGDDVAIVTEVAGTTRDTVRELIQIDGIPVHVIDTAGLRDTEDPVERIGIARTWAAIAKADLLLLLVDHQHGLGPAEQHILAQLPPALPRMRIFNKIDLAPAPAQAAPTDALNTLYLSAKTGEGLPELRSALLQHMGWQGPSEGLFLARTRHLHALSQAQQHLQAVQQQYPQLELMAEELRLTQEALSSITGEFTADDLLGEIFSRFCIGK